MRRTAVSPTSCRRTTTTRSSCPRDYAGGFERDFNGTGPFRLERYTAKARASFVRNDDYWGAKAMPERVLFSFYDSIQAQVLAMQGGQLDVLLHVPVQGGQALLADPRLNIVALKSSAHEQLHMRTDRGRVRRQARAPRGRAVPEPRETWCAACFADARSLGNDSPFAPIFPATDPDGAAARRSDLFRGQGAAGGGRRAQRLSRRRSPPSGSRRCRTMRW